MKLIFGQRAINELEKHKKSIRRRSDISYSFLVFFAFL